MLFALDPLVPGALQGFGDAGGAQPGGAESADAGFAGGDGEFVGAEEGEEGAGGVVGVGAGVIERLRLHAWLVGVGWWAWVGGGEGGVPEGVGLVRGVFSEGS